jgi:hypothetical protein
MWHTEQTGLYPDLMTFALYLLLDYNRWIDRKYIAAGKPAVIRPVNGYLLLHCLPDNKSRLVVTAADGVWQKKLEQPWQLFQAELERQGWIDVQPTASTKTDEMVRFELVFKGTLNLFQAAVKAIGYSGAIPPESMLDIFCWAGEYDPDLVPFEFCLEIDKRRIYAEQGGYIEHDWLERGNLLVQTLPDNNCRMIVKVKNEVWRKLAQPWRLFQAALERQGWIELQPIATGATPDALTSPTSDAGNGQSTAALDVRQLHKKLDECFNEEDLRDLCFGLVEYENLGGSTKSGKARELITWFEKRSRLNELVELLRQKRPNVSW